jgi:hypothetical protein
MANTSPKIWQTLSRAQVDLYLSICGVPVKGEASCRATSLLCYAGPEGGGRDAPWCALDGGQVHLLDHRTITRWRDLISAPGSVDTHNGVITDAIASGVLVLPV